MIEKPKSANNAPVYSPLIPDPIVPYHCKNSKTVYAVCEMDESVIKEYLSHTPFSYVDNRAIVYVNDFMESPQLPYRDAGVIVQVEYKGIRGGFYLFEYENDDEAIATGRELWGYPKKYAKIDFWKSENKITGCAVRRGCPIIHVELMLGEENSSSFEKLNVFPHLNLQTIPNPDGSILTQRVISRDNSSECTTISEEFGKASVSLNSNDKDPLGRLQPTKVLGGGYSVTDFLASPKHGLGKIVDTII